MTDEAHLRPALTPADRARQRFVAGMRRYVLNDVALNLRDHYEQQIGPRFEAQHHREPNSGEEVHAALRPERLFRFYSAMRRATQEMVWRCVTPAIERDAERIARRVTALNAATDSSDLSPLDIDIDIDIDIDGEVRMPEYADAVDTHLMPGGYHQQRGRDDCRQPLLYDSGFRVFHLGLFGEALDDITQSVSMFFSKRYPAFRPQSILDLGCTLGHSTLPWKARYPTAEVHGIDVAAPMVSFARTRARAIGIAAQFHQRDAESTGFPDASFDLVYSCMFLHELPQQRLRSILREAYRLLRKGGVMLHYELPPQGLLSPYENFYQDWDGHYNNEPYHNAFRGLDMTSECVAAGFGPQGCFAFMTPSLNLEGSDVIAAAAEQAGREGERYRPQLSDEVRWYFVGAWK